MALLVLGLPLLFRTFVIELFRVPAGSMAPTLQTGDTFLVRKNAYSRSRPPQRGEIIVFKFPPDPSKDFVKRVVAIAGDRISVCGGRVQLNGQPLARERLSAPCTYSASEDGDDVVHPVACVLYREGSGESGYLTMINRPAGGAEEPCSPALTIPEGMLFVLGDNRDNSYDSRFWGLVPIENVRGKAWRVWLAGHRATARERWLQPIR